MCLRGNYEAIGRRGGRAVNWVKIGVRGVSQARGRLTKLAGRTSTIQSDRQRARSSSFIILPVTSMAALAPVKKAAVIGAGQMGLGIA